MTVREEVWRAASGFEGSYEVSDLGRVRSVRTGRIRRSSLTTGGYEQIPLSVNGNRKTVLVHRLVLSTFVGPCPDGGECCHGDGDKLNNRLFNLRWDSKRANMADRDLHGATMRGERHSNAKLSEKQVLAILQDRRTLKAIASDFGLSWSTVGRIKQGTAWSHVRHS